MWNWEGQESFDPPTFQLFEFCQSFEVNSLTNNQGQRHGILRICIWATKTPRPLVKCHKDRATSTRPILPLYGFVLIPAAVISSNSCLFTEQQVIEVYSAGTRLWVGTFRIEKSCKSFQLHSLPRMFTNTFIMWASATNITISLDDDPLKERYQEAGGRLVSSPSVISISGWFFFESRLGW